jgi:hypothetical protein
LQPIATIVDMDNATEFQRGNGMSDEPNVLLTFEDGDIIVAKRFSFVSGGRMGGSVLCDDGSRRLVAVNATPTNAEIYGVEVAADANYEEKRIAIEPAIEELGDRGEDVPDLSTLAQINEWLNAEMEMDEFQMQEWGQNVSQYGPGLAIQEALTFDEEKALGLRQQDLGGPMSSVWCVSTTTSIDELNKVLAAKELPFVFIDDEGPEEE